MAALSYFLKLNPKERPSWREVLKQFDFIGLLSILIGSVCIILGFSIASTAGWQNSAVIALIVVGGVVTIFFGVWEMYTTKAAIIPPRLFRTLTTTSILIGTFFHSIGYLSSSFYLPVYFQVANEASALESGIQLLPFTLGASIVSIICGLTVARFKRYRIIIWTCWTIQVVGYGLMTTLRNDSNRAKQVTYLLVAALGVGGLFQTPLLALQAAVPIADMSQATGAYVFVRSLGGCISISIGGTIVSSISQKKLQNIPNAGSLAGLSTEDLTGIKNIQPDSLKLQVQAAYSEAIATIFIVVVVLIGCGLISSLFIKRYSMYANNVKQGEQKVEDKEKQQKQHTEQDLKEQDNPAPSDESVKTAIEHGVSHPTDKVKE